MGYCVAADLSFFINIQERNATTIKCILGLHVKGKGNHAHIYFQKVLRRLSKY